MVSILNDLTTEEKLRKARIQLQTKNPFFSYLSLFIKFEEDTKGILPNDAGMGVSAEGRVLYKKKWVDSLEEKELVGVITHEILHLSLQHLLRRGVRNKELWNIATDLCVNTFLMNEGYVLPSGIKADAYGEFEMGGITIEDVQKKTAEEIFDLLKSLIKENLEVGSPSFDEHIFGDANSEELDKLGKVWIERTSEAYVFAKQKGDTSQNLERLFGKLQKSEVNWKVLLQKFVMNSILYDYTWAKPSKNSIATGTYLPSILKEKIEIGVAIDTSGSVRDKELGEFLSEIIAIAQTYRERMTMFLATHDTQFKQEFLIENGNIAKIKKLKIKGGGGTSHKDICEHFRKRKRCSAVIFFTDGESDLDDIDFGKYPFKSIFVISSNGTDCQLRNKNVFVVKVK